MASPGSVKRRQIQGKTSDMMRWLLTYADMITLLLLFFIVLYSMSSINPSKYSDLSQALETIFSGGRPEIFSANSLSTGEGFMGNIGRYPAAKNRSGKKEDFFKQAISALQKDIQALKVKVVMNQMGVVIELASDLYFDGGSAKVREESIPTLKTVSSVLKNVSNYVRIEGYTDNQNIVNGNENKLEGSLKFDSNWELAAQRAINVLKMMESFGVERTRLSAVTYGDTRPVESNNTPEERSYNRVVNIVVVQEE
jgi:chemotaxis protein MotB